MSRCIETSCANICRNVARLDVCRHVIVDAFECVYVCMTRSSLARHDHRSRECPKKEHICTYCGAVGHIERTCYDKEKRAKRGGKVARGGGAPRGRGRGRGMTAAAASICALVTSFCLLPRGGITSNLLSHVNKWRSQKLLRHVAIGQQSVFDNS